MDKLKNKKKDKSKVHKKKEEKTDLAVDSTNQPMVLENIDEDIEINNTAGK